MVLTYGTLSQNLLNHVAPSQGRSQSLMFFFFFFFFFWGGGGAHTCN